MRKDREVEGRIQESINRVEIQYTTQIQDMTLSLRQLREENEKLVGEKNRLRGSITDLERELGNKDRENGDKLRRCLG